MKLLEGSEGAKSATHVDIDLKAARPPSETGFSVQAELPGWPAAPNPKVSLRPPPGAACASLANSSAGVIGVALFGLSEAEVERAVAQISARQRLDMNFIPIFMTDCPNQAIFRRAGYLAEYFPTGTYGHSPDYGAFRDKFELVWRKWGIGSLIDLSAGGFLRTRIDGLPLGAGKAESTTAEVQRKNPLPPPDIAALRADYLSRGLDREPDTFVLYRIIGNDLYPRHRRGQVADNVRFILEHEPQLADCEKRWVVNRIIDPDQEALIIRMLEERGHSYIRIPFHWDEYRAVEWDFEGFPEPAFFLRGKFDHLGDERQARSEVQLRRKKNNYVMNNNGARNVALRDGRSRAKWVLPWDGNCFLTSSAWEEIRNAVSRQAYLKYFVVPMARLTDNVALLGEGFRPPAEDEPQILFRRDAVEEFDESFPYGRRPKVALMWRLGIAGDWDNWHDDPWDPPRPPLSEEAGEYGRAGWVARLFSGQASLESATKVALRGRGLARVEAIQATLDYLDEQAARKTFRREALTAFDESLLERLGDASDELSASLVEQLNRAADQALQRKPYSVVDKTTLPPSQDPHDYWHPAPYWWPNPETANGLPYVYRDGERAPGTRLYEPESEKYDRTRLQRLFDDTTILALAWRVTGRTAYAAHAANLVRRWFVDPQSAMNPHLRYAQVQVGHNGNEGQRTGVIEMKDFYYFLDAVRLLERAQILDQTDIATFRSWLLKYLDWLQTSSQGSAERRANNNHGACYDLQVGSIAAYLDDVPLLLSTLRTSRERISEQFDAEGRQPHEMTRTLTAHYCCFNLQSWVNLATLAAACGDSLWQFAGADGRGMQRAFDWLLPHMNSAEWPYPQIEPFDHTRFAPLFFIARQLYCDDFGVRTEAQPKLPSTKALYYPHDGIKPFWQFGTFMGPLFQASATNRIASKAETESAA
jgi:hypothetical protein